MYKVGCGKEVNKRMFIFSQEKDMMDRIRQCYISATHRRPVLTHFSKQNYMQGAWHYKHEVCTWFVLHNYCTPKKLDVISISHASRWVVTEYALTALYLKMYTPSKLSVCFNLNLNSYVIIQWTAICSITYPYHWAK
jgi:hypothetical protein